METMLGSCLIIGSLTVLVLRSFLWRLAKNILPTKDNLRKKGILLDETCSLCNSAPETALHLFMDCAFARQVFSSSVLSYHILENMDICNWLRSMLVCGDFLSAQILSSLIHKVWTARNMQLYQQKACSLLAVASVAEFNLRNPEANRFLFS
ncbi:unnamed protein product [Vicia faba]|uniref:Reverse transcriptase zinc-binding domain-containing protein n=1 Tax=Vicia faba TaxID=3906 RepID=A0AAV1AM18_VICFA|nr:unnamed protein product [Vicia faba]